MVEVLIIILLMNRITLPTLPSIKEREVLEFNAPPFQLCHVFLGANNALPVTIATNLLDTKVEVLISVLQTFKRSI